MAWTMDEKMKDQISSLIAALPTVVELDVTGTDENLEALCRAVSSIDPQKVLFRRVGALPGGYADAVGIGRKGSSKREIFAGFPDGHEFSSFILSILRNGGYACKVDQRDMEAMVKIEPGLYETFYSPECHNCPDIVQALGISAYGNDSVIHVAVNGASYTQVLKDRNIMGVPVVYPQRRKTPSFP